MSNVWDERAEAYRTSEAHREGRDLDLLVEWAQGAGTALDVATGGGHVARRLREAGLEVVSLDPAAGMQPDVVATAEHIPFPDRSFDIVACRVAAHHFENVGAAVREMARVARDLVLVADNLFVSEAAEEADRVRDPSHVRNYAEAEWGELFRGAGLEVEEVDTYVHPVLLEPWVERAGCTGEDAERVRALVADRLDGDHVQLERICLKGRRRAER